MRKQSEYHVVTLPGDGIGPEITRAAARVIDAAISQTPGLHINLMEREAGAGLFRKTGQTLPASVLQDCIQADAVLLAAIGIPDVRHPDGTEVQVEMMVGLRRALDLYAAVRPIR